MSEESSPGSLVVDIGRFLISEVLGYVAFLLNLPFALSLLAMAVVIVIVLQDVYGLSPLRLIAWRLPTTVHFDGKDFVRFYALASLALFLIWEPIRAIFRLKRATLGRHLLAGTIIATAGWGFVLAHVPVMKMAPGSSRMLLAAVFSFFYLLGIGGFALGSLITRASDMLIDRLVGNAPGVRPG